jgi:hypothetical protein
MPVDDNDVTEAGDKQTASFGTVSLDTLSLIRCQLDIAGLLKLRGGYDLKQYRLC